MTSNEIERSSRINIDLDKNSTLFIPTKEEIKEQTQQSQQWQQLQQSQQSQQLQQSQQTEEPEEPDDFLELQRYRNRIRLNNLIVSIQEKLNNDPTSFSKREKKWVKKNMPALAKEVLGNYKDLSADEILKDENIIKKIRRIKTLNAYDAAYLPFLIEQLEKKEIGEPTEYKYTHEPKPEGSILKNRGGKHRGGKNKTKKNQNAKRKKTKKNK